MLKLKGYYNKIPLAEILSVQRQKIVRLHLSQKHYKMMSRQESPTASSGSGKEGDNKSYLFGKKKALAFVVLIKKKSQKFMNLRRVLAFSLLATIVVVIFIRFNDGFMKRSILRKPRIYVPTPPPKSKSGSYIGAVAGAVAGATVSLLVSYFVLPAALAGIGFTSLGVTGGSLAAIWQSYIGEAVASGTTFAVLQSISMGGLGFATYGFLTTIGMLSGAQLGTILIGENEVAVNPQLIEKLFDAYDIDEDDSITNSELKEILRSLEPKMLNDIDTRYHKATNRTLRHFGKIKFSEYVKLFNLKLFEGEELKKMLEGAFVEKRQEKGNVYCQDVKEMLPHLRVTSSEEKIQAACNYVTNGEFDKPLSFLEFLRIFGL